MKNSKLVEILSVFDTKEMARLGLFLKSPYFQQPAISRDEWRLFELLDRYFPNFEEGQLEKTKVFAQIYPQERFVKGKLEKKMSSLIKRIEQFIDQEELTNSRNKVQQLLNVSRFYRKRKLTRLSKINLAHLRKKQDGIRKKESTDLLNEYLIQREITEYQNLYITRKEDLNLVKVLHALDDFYLLTKLEHACDLLSQREFHNKIDLRDSLLFLEKIEPRSLKNNYVDLPLMKVYLQFFYTLQQMREKEERYFKAFHDLENLLESYNDQLPFNALKIFHTFCRSFYTLQFNSGNLGIQEKIFTLYKDHLESGYLYLDGGLTPGIYKNIVTCGLNLKEFDWVYSFLQKSKYKIVGTKSPQDIHQFNMAIYYFRMKNYEEAMKCLVDTYEDLYYQIAAKRMEIKIHFEENSVLLDSKVEAFRHFLRRLSKKKLPEKVRQANNNFINCIKQVGLSKTYNNPNRISILQEKISKLSPLKEKDWLLEKLMY